MKIPAFYTFTRRTVTHSKNRVPFSSMTDAVRPKFAEGEDQSRLMTETATLLDSQWSLDETRQGLEKTFNFPTYAKALVRLAYIPLTTRWFFEKDFMLLIGVETKLSNHHPDLRNVRAFFSLHIAMIRGLILCARAINPCFTIGRLTHLEVFLLKIFEWLGCVMIRQGFLETWSRVQVIRKPRILMHKFKEKLIIRNGFRYFSAFRCVNLELMPSIMTSWAESSTEWIWIKGRLHKLYKPRKYLKKADSGQAVRIQAANQSWRIARV